MADECGFKLLTESLSLCWVHEGRHYKKLNPLVTYHQQLLDKFREDFWDYYRQLLAYKDDPSPAMAEILRDEERTAIRHREWLSTTR